MASADYFTLTDFETLRGIAPSSTTSPNDDQVQKYIDLAVLQFERDVGVYMEQTGVTENVYASSFGFYTKNVPINTINTISISNVDRITPTFTAIESTDYRLIDDAAGRILLRSPVVTREYQIDMDTGYSYQNMPDNVKYLIYLMTINQIFQFHLFENNISGDVTKIVDVDVYKEITKGGNALTGSTAMANMISDAKANLKGQLKTMIKW